MKLVKITKLSDFEKIKKDSLIAVKWMKGVKHLGKELKEICVYKNTKYLNRPKEKELVLIKNSNLYFNCERYLEGTSIAKEVYFIK